jgi:16S rRNA (cytosine1402-N4)-methyltransferase
MSNEQPEFMHDSVLLNESVHGALNGRRDGIYVDGTFGRGGHTQFILSQLGPDATVFAFDKDPQAIEVGTQLAQKDARFQIIHDSFANMASVFESKQLLGSIDGILLDLGVSSPQLDDADRGFSFMKDGPLDMRMDNSKGMSAFEWLSVANEKEVADVLWKYGEERFSRRIAPAMLAAVKEKGVNTTLALAEVIKAANPRWEKHKHPATRCFQAIRIFINRELDDIQQCLDSSIRCLRSGGRLSVISFHSLEDRMVKQFIRRQEKGREIPKNLPIMDTDLDKTMRSVGKAIKPSQEEMKQNNRARSAVLRIAERL